MKYTFSTALVAVSLAFASQASAKEVKPAEMEVRGLHAVEAPWQPESLSLDTRQVQALQVITIPLSEATKKEWAKVNRDKRGIRMIVDGEDGKPRLVGRPVIKATFRVLLMKDGDILPMSEAEMITTGGEAINILLPPDVDFRGTTAFVLADRGRHALTLAGEIIDLDKGKKRLITSKLPDQVATSVVEDTALSVRGEPSGLYLDMLEATFSEHAVLNNSLRYSGLPGTFLSKDMTRYPSVAALYTREDTVGDRLITCGNGTLDPSMFTGIGALVKVGSNLIVALKKRC